MINHADIEAIIGCKTLVTDRMQRAIEDWYDAAIDGLPLDKSPETLTLDLPALICAELARLTTLELEATVEGSDRADWINAQLQRVLSPRRRRIFTVALALGSGIWKPYQSGKKLGISFCNASRYFPVAHDVEGSLTEGVFIDTIQDDDNYYHRMEWMHVLEHSQDLRDEELAQLEDYDLAAPTRFPCIKVVNLAFRSATQDSLGSPEDLSIRPEWDEIEPVAYLTGLDKLPVGYFVTPIVNSIEPDSELGAAMFEPARKQIIDADEQYTRLDWEYEGGELAVDTDERFLKPTAAGQQLSKARIQGKHISNPAFCVIIGLVLGLMSSFLGIGGGPINLVVLFYFFSMETKTAAQNSLYIILFSQITSLLTTLITHSVPEFTLPALVLMIAGGIGGGIAGRTLNKRMSSRAVDKLFLVLMGIIILISIYNAVHYMGV